MKDKTKLPIRIIQQNEPDGTDKEEINFNLKDIGL